MISIYKFMLVCQVEIGLFYSIRRWISGTHSEKLKPGIKFFKKTWFLVSLKMVFLPH
jgi:hypothetical protein